MTQYEKELKHYHECLEKAKFDKTYIPPPPPKRPIVEPMFGYGVELVIVFMLFGIIIGLFLC